MTHNEEGASSSSPLDCHSKSHSSVRSVRAMSMSDAGITASSESVRRMRPIRSRKRGACTNCRLRKTRCDAISGIMPGASCSNCAAFELNCSSSTRQLDIVQGSEPSDHDKDMNKPMEGKGRMPTLHPMQVLENQLMYEANGTELYAQFLNPALREAPIVEPGRVAYLGESSILTHLVDDDRISAGVVHYQIPGSFEDSRAKVAKIDTDEIGLLRQKAALSLPPWRICDDLVESYFKWIAPALPIVHRSRFMRQYRDPNNPPSLLLLQAIFLAASTVVRTLPAVTDKQLYQRVKALYDSGYEDDRIINVQVLLLIAFYWEHTGGYVEQVLYWNGLAITVALGSGIHRSAEQSPLSTTDKRLWKRIWWTLFIRDRSTALLGQVVQIRIDDTDVEMIREDDFIDQEHPPDPIHVQFFIQLVKLCVIADTILLTQSLGPPQPEKLWAKGDARITLSRWLSTRPKELRWEEAEHSSCWSASLHSRFEAVLSLMHRQDEMTVLADNAHVRFT